MQSVREVLEAMTHISSLEDVWIWYQWLDTGWQVAFGLGAFGLLMAAWRFLIATLPISD